MSMELIGKIEADIAELESRFKKHSEFISKANASIEQLSSDKVLATNELNKIDGAVQMAKAILSNLKQPVPSSNEILTCSAE